MIRVQRFYERNYFNKNSNFSYCEIYFLDIFWYKAKRYYDFIRVDVDKKICSKIGTIYQNDKKYFKGLKQIKEFVCLR
jgi:hypothetical protein